MSDVLCYHCGAPADGEAEYCPQCGTQFSRARIYQPSPSSCLIDLGNGCLLIGGLALTVIVFVISLMAGIFGASRSFRVISGSMNKVGANREFNLSTIVILSAMVALSVLIMVSANKFLKRK